MKAICLLLTIPEESLTRPTHTLPQLCCQLELHFHPDLRLPNCVLIALRLWGLARLIRSSEQRMSAKGIVLVSLPLSSDWDLFYLPLSRAL